MKNLKILTDGELLSETQQIAKREKAATIALLEHLLEIERRDLALLQGFRSTWDYVHRGLGYSEGAASERIAAMRCLARAPKVREMIKSGTISLTVAAKVQHVVRAIEKRAAKRIGPEETQELLEKVVGKSKREADEVFANLAPDLFGQPQRKVALDAEALELLEKAKILLGADTDVETVKRALRELVSRKEKDLAKLGHLPRTRPAALGSRYIPKHIRREVWRRAESKCQFVGPQGRCGSTHRLQIDHMRPMAMGGTTELQNLRLLCENHNLSEARRMGLFWPFDRPKGVELRT